MTDLAIAARDLRKSYHGFPALNDVSLEIVKGERFGLIGPDGAGKTTLIRVLCALTPPDSGSAIIGGLDMSSDVRRIRSSVGYMPQRFSLYPDLSVRENLRFYADLFGVSKEARSQRTDDLLKFSRLHPFLDRKAGKLSGGMKQKLALACILIHPPEILLLDEPTTGVDPLSRHEFWQLLEKLTEQGITILITTAYMEEAANCHRVALMSRGKLLDTGTPKELIEKYPHPLFEVITADPFGTASFLERQAGVLSVQIFGSGIHAVFDRKERAEELRHGLIEAGYSVKGMIPIVPNIEDVFVARLGVLSGVLT